jgi:hypothetical protein
MQLYLQAFFLPLSYCGPENAQLYSEVYSTSASMYKVCLKSSVNGIRKQTKQKIQTN